MKRLLIVLSFLLCYSIAFSQNGWIQQQSGVTESLHALYFINTNTGWVVGDSGKILHTTNGGINWALQNSNTRKPLLRVVFTDENNGIAEGNFTVNLPFCYEGVVTVSTSNGGADWILVRESISNTYFTDLNITGNIYYASLAGIELQNCMSSTGSILKTSNNGLNWDFMTPSSELSYQFNTINFINDLDGWAIGEFYNDVSTMWKQKIIRTFNGGTDWIPVYLDSIDFDSFKKMRFMDSNTGYLLNGAFWSYWGNLMKSSDGGYTWHASDSINAVNLSSYDFINADTGWCIGGNKIIRTNNGGTNWSYQNSTVTNHSLSSVQFVNSNVGYIAGSNGLILKTGNGGLTSIEFSFLVPSGYILEQNFPNPFNPVTVIHYSLPKNNFLTLKVYNVLGVEVSTLISEKQNAGNHEIEFNGGKFPSGVYYYKIESDEFTAVRKMLLIK